jgi:hypothetical protein
VRIGVDLPDLIIAGCERRRALGVALPVLIADAVASRSRHRVEDGSLMIE